MIGARAATSYAGYCGSGKIAFEDANIANLPSWSTWNIANALSASWHVLKAARCICAVPRTAGTVLAAASRGRGV